MLYDFNSLDKKLDELGFPEIESESGFRLIKGVDFEEAYKSGSIEFEDDGIYLEYQGKKYRGYMFIQEAYITYNGARENFPKFHLLKCQKIQEFIEAGMFRQRYEWSNSDVNDLIDVQTQIEYKDIKLNVCSFCRSNYLGQVADTKDFFDSLDKKQLEEENVKVDIFGYVPERQKISRAYRQRKGYVCERCSVKPLSSLHKHWWHTHHVDGIKTNNNIENLKCYCIDCHSQVDERHRQNFSSGSRLIQRKRFIKEYGNEFERFD